MSDQITAGSVVELKSGGPHMTVSEVKSWNGIMTAFCDWFDGSTSKSNGFPVASLKLVAEKPQQGSLKPKVGTYS
jgi:uncharacterized protein YodC (DUF2158 family)